MDDARKLGERNCRNAAKNRDSGRKLLKKTLAQNGCFANDDDDDKCGRCVRLTTLPPCCAVVMKSGNLNFLKPSGPLQGCNGTALPLYIYIYIHTHTHTHTHTYIYIKGISRLVDITEGGDFLGLCDQKSSYKHVSDFGRLRSYGYFLIPVHVLV